VVWQQSFVPDRFDFISDGPGMDSTVFILRLIAIIAILAVGAATLRRHNSGIVGRKSDSYSIVKEFFILYTVLYMLLSFLLTGLFVHPPEQYLYIINLIAILFLISRTRVASTLDEHKSPGWLVVALICISVTALLAVIAVNSHSELPGSQVRF
jgi:hypothetical protein